MTESIESLAREVTKGGVPAERFGKPATSNNHCNRSSEPAEKQNHASRLKPARNRGLDRSASNATPRRATDAKEYDPDSSRLLR